MRLETLVLDAVDKASRLDYTDFNQELLELPGFSGKMTRVMLSRLLSNPGMRYLEIGVWGGSTFCSALHNNKPDYAAAIDNFSQTWEDDFGFNPARKFEENARKFIKHRFDFFDVDCFKFDTKELPVPINCYFYDGGHLEYEQYEALAYYKNAMDNEFIYIVDDANWLDVKIGTYRAIRDNDLFIQREWMLPTRYNGDYNSWWNGLGIWVLRKGQ